MRSLLEVLECGPCTLKDFPAKTKTICMKKREKEKLWKTKVTQKLKEPVLKEKENETEKENGKNDREKCQ